MNSLENQIQNYMSSAVVQTPKIMEFDELFDKIKYFEQSFKKEKKKTQKLEKLLDKIDNVR